MIYAKFVELMVFFTLVAALEIGKCVKIYWFNCEASLIKHEEEKRLTANRLARIDLHGNTSW